MKHPSSLYLYDYWNRLRAGAIAPRRGDVEPADMRPILGDTFILEVVDRSTYRFRLAGTRICSTYCREMKGRNFVDLWGKDDHAAVADVLTATAKKGVASVFGFDGHSDRGQTLGFEVVLLPLRHTGPTFDRILGVMAAIDRPYWLGVHPIIRQNVTSLRVLSPADEPATGGLLVAAAKAPPAAEILQFTPGVVRRGAFLVHEGGKR